MEKKTCVKCTKEKDEIEFSFRSKLKGIRFNICKECHRKYSSTNYQENKERCLARHRLRKRTLREQVLNLYANKCENCGCPERSLLELNHVNGDGNVERKIKGKYAEQIYREALMKDGRYNLLCKLCNIQHYIETVLGIKGFKVSYASMVK